LIFNWFENTDEELYEILQARNLRLV